MQPSPLAATIIALQRSCSIMRTYIFSSSTTASQKVKPLPGCRPFRLLLLKHVQPQGRKDTDNRCGQPPGKALYFLSLPCPTILYVRLAFANLIPRAARKIGRWSQTEVSLSFLMHSPSSSSKFQLSVCPWTSSSSRSSSMSWKSLYSTQTRTACCGKRWMTPA